MSDLSKSIEALNIKVKELSNKQNDFAVEIHKLKVELERLKSPDKVLEKEPIPKVAFQESKPIEKLYITERKKEPEVKLINDESSWEKYIGENLISKVGILVTVIGAIIGAKYAIDKNMMSPIVRIIAGYALGIALMGLAFKLKEKYHNYSSVLLSGSIAIIYFISYAAYAYFGLLSREIAFVMMVIFTVFTVFQAIRYNRQFIALLGLVGAYGVPFLLSNNSGNIQSLFIYILIINMGVLFISVKKNWRRVFGAAFGLTWGIYGVWNLSGFSTDKTGVALLFGGLFFLIFYAVFLLFKLIHKEEFKQGDIVKVLLNNFIFFSAGYTAIYSLENPPLLTLFTILNMVLHALIALFLSRKGGVDIRLVHLISGMALLFLTLTIPVQFEGPWIPLFWMLEAAVLYWVGYRHKTPFYGSLSFPLLILGIIGIFLEWNFFYYEYDFNQYVILNPMFLVTIMSAIVLMVISYIHNKENPSQIKGESLISNLLLFGVVALTYGGLLLEVISIFNIPSGLSTWLIDMDEMGYKKAFAVQLYSFVYVLGLSLIAWYKVKSNQFAYFTLIVSGLAIVVFVMVTLPLLDKVSELFLAHDISISLFGGRYLMYLVISGILFLGYKNQQFIPQSEFKLPVIIESVCWLVALIVGSYELMYWSAKIGGKVNDKLGLTIFFGLFALSAIVYGIWKSKSHLRIGAFCLLGFALLKLFFFDIAQFSTITKTITFLSIGITLLLVSFLYNKYKDRISD